MRFAPFARPGTTLKHKLALIRMYTRAIILDHHAELSKRAIDQLADLDPDPAVTILVGIVQHIAQYLHQITFIALEISRLIHVH